MAHKTCNGCGTDTKALASVPYAVFESSMMRADLLSKRLVAVIILLIVLLVGSNVGWLIYESQFEVVEETTTTITQDNADGYNNYIGNDGDIVNGKADNNN